MRMSHLSAAVLRLSRSIDLLFTRARIIRSPVPIRSRGIKVRAWHAAAHRRAGARFAVPRHIGICHTRLTNETGQERHFFLI